MLQDELAKLSDPRTIVVDQCGSSWSEATAALGSNRRATLGGERFQPNLHGPSVSELVAGHSLDIVGVGYYGAIYGAAALARERLFQVQA